MTYRQTPEYKRRRAIGAAIADQLPQLMTPTDCAKQLGISTAHLRELECIALWKLSEAAKRIVNRDGIQLRELFPIKTQCYAKKSTVKFNEY